MKLFLLLMVIFVLVLAGCTTGTQIRGEEEFRYGTRGLDVRLFGALSAEGTYENMPLNLVFEINNEGAYDVKHGILTLEVENPYVEIAGPKQKTFFLRGKSPNVPQGESIDIGFQTYVGRLDPSSSIHKSILYATVCYDYQTKLTADVCIDTDPYNQRVTGDRKVCNRQDLRPGNQGSPIAIERVEVRTYQMDANVYLPEFVFHIRNVRKGLTFNYDQVQTICSSNIIPEGTLNKLRLFAQLSETVLACDKPEFHLVNDVARVVCGLPEGHDINVQLDTYLAPLYVELNYGYSETVTHTFDIKR